jgi:hypothetical protein
MIFRKFYRWLRLYRVSIRFDVTIAPGIEQKFSTAANGIEQPALEQAENGAVMRKLALHKWK